MRVGEVKRVSGRSGIPATITRARSKYYIRCLDQRNYALTHHKARRLAIKLSEETPWADPII